MDGYLPVRVHLPLDAYRALHIEAEVLGMSVAELVVQRATPPTHGGRRSGAGRRSGYTSRAGEEISAGRRFNQTWAEISRQLGISEHTARTWAARYATEVREQNMRNRAERNAS